VNEPRDLDGGPLAWREFGTGDVIVFLHGLGGSRIAWEPQLRGLADGWRCVAWDMPGYGLSAPLKPLTFAAVADAVVRLLDKLHVDRAHLVGLSLGGMHALHTVLEHPDRVRSLVLADTSPAFGVDSTGRDEWIAARTARLDAGETPADIGPAVVAAITGPDFAGSGFVEATEAFARISSDSLRASCQCLVTHDVRHRLGEIESPTLVVVGALDRETPPAYSEALTAGIGPAELVVIPGVGHLTPAEAPDTFNGLVRTFLSARSNVPA
jgi:3-oxoadipate enol-lactonase